MSIDPEVKRALDMRLATGEIGQEEYKKTVESLEEVATKVPAPPAPVPTYSQPASHYSQGYSQPVTLSKGLYLGSYIGGFIAVMILYGIGIILMLEREEEAGLLMMLLAVLVVIFPVTMYSIMIYKMWKSIQPYGQTTPGKAIGFMFIPFYNFYWVFVALKGWFDDYNKLVEEKNLDVPKLPVGIALTVCILTVISMVPYIGMIASLPGFVMVCIMIVYVCNGVNALAECDLNQSDSTLDSGC